MNTAETETALRARFSAPEYALLFNVRNGTGFARKTERYADAIAMSLWPSRGLELIGFELKASRGDWLRELKDPEKAEEISKYCDRWYTVVGDGDIVQLGELPMTWGLIVPRGTKLVIAKEAPKLDATPTDRLLLASMLRAACTQSPSEIEIKKRVSAEVDEHRKQADRDRESRLRHELEHIKALENTIREFQKASGVEITSWNAGNIGAAVKTVLNGGLKHLHQQFKDIEQRAAILHAEATNAVASTAEQEKVRT